MRLICLAMQWRVKSCSSTGRRAMAHSASSPRSFTQFLCWCPKLYFRLLLSKDTVKTV